MIFNAEFTTPFRLQVKGNASFPPCWEGRLEMKQHKGAEDLLDLR